MNNQFNLIGRLTKNVELRATSNNKSVCNIPLAVQNGKDDTTFINITVWNKIAETVSNYCQKGDLIAINGSIKNHNWEDKEGNKHYDYTFIGNKVSFLATSKKETKKESKEKAEEDPFAEFGEQITLDENCLD